jgi:hypothetical protein
MKLYIYNIETMEVIATAEGDSNQECENKAAEYFENEDYAATYSPAFGFDGGLIENDEAEEL